MCAFLAPTRAVAEHDHGHGRAGVRRGVQLHRQPHVPMPSVRTLPRRLRGCAARSRAIGDLFVVSRFMVAHANNLSTTTAPANGQPLLVPLQCGCPSRSPSSYAPMQYQIGPGDTYWIVSTTKLQNLTQYKAVERMNPTLVPTDLDVGTMVTFPVFCQCPAAADNATTLVTYVM
jgi:hypothetical protein|uniref:NFP second LysM domain-containing protein n=2 Tax=Zea mays TaxID=4577 RepID=A0A804QYB8_MAIZE